MKAYLELISRKPVLLACFVMSLAFILVIFPLLSGDEPSLDTRMSGYSLADVLAAMAAYGELGRGRYALIRFSLDTLFPICYVSFYAGLIYRFAPHEKLRSLAFLPIAGGAFDLAENVQIIVMLLQYPDIGATQVAWASFSTQVKFALSRVSMGLAVMALLWTAGRTAYRHAKQETGV